MDGLPFSGTLAELTGPDHRVYHPPFFDETGAVADDDSPWVWTATDFDGVRSGTTCGDWSSMTGEALTGYAERSGREWTDFNDVDCEDDGYVHLLCFELGAGDPLDWERTPGHLVFLTSTDGTGNLGAWEEAGDATGGDAGDAICRARAAAAHLPRPDAFVAWLSDSGAGIDAVERVTAGGPFVRVDGFVFSPTEDALLGSAPDFDSSLNVTELETYLEAPFPGIRAWTGSTNQGVSDPDFDCSDWSSTAGQGAGGEVIAVGEDNWQNAGSPSCSSTHPLYCFSNVEILSWDNFERGDLHRWTSDSSGP
jgi:hypothetical protein